MALVWSPCISTSLIFITSPCSRLISRVRISVCRSSRMVSAHLSMSLFLARRNSLLMVSEVGSIFCFFMRMRHSSPVRLTIPTSWPGMPSTATTSPSTTSSPSGRRKNSLRLFLKRTSTTSKLFSLKGLRMFFIQFLLFSLLQLLSSCSGMALYELGQLWQPRVRKADSS